MARDDRHTGRAPTADKQAPDLGRLALEARVGKKLARGVAGTKKLAARYGDALVCVRYRRDRLGLFRYTTVELVVDAQPLHAERFDRASFGIDLSAPGDRALRRGVAARGGRWDARERLWRVRGAVVRELGIWDRIRAL